jgi:hypothetical protein
VDFSFAGLFSRALHFLSTSRPQRQHSGTAHQDFKIYLLSKNLIIYCRLLSLVINLCLHLYFEWSQSNLLSLFLVV